MKKEDIVDALNELPDEMLQEADRMRSDRKKRKFAYTKWLAVAACIVIVIFVAAQSDILRISAPVPGSGAEVPNDGAAAGETAGGAGELPGGDSEGELPGGAAGDPAGGMTESPEDVVMALQEEMEPLIWEAVQNELHAEVTAPPAEYGEVLICYDIPVSLDDLTREASTLMPYLMDQEYHYLVYATAANCDVAVTITRGTESWEVASVGILREGDVHYEQLRKGWNPYYEDLILVRSIPEGGDVVEYMGFLGIKADGTWEMAPAAKK